MATRGIAAEWVAATIAQPDHRQIDPSDPVLIRSFKSIDAMGDRVLRVVHRPDGDDMLVVTAFFDRGAR